MFIFVYHFLLPCFHNLCATVELTFPMLTPRKSNAGKIRQASMTDSVNSFFQTSIISSKYLRVSRLWVSRSSSLFSSLSVVKQVQAEITESKWTFAPFLRAWPPWQQPLFGQQSPEGLCMAIHKCKNECKLCLCSEALCDYLGATGPQEPYSTAIAPCGSFSERCCAFEILSMSRFHQSVWGFI